MINLVTRLINDPDRMRGRSPYREIKGGESIRLLEHLDRYFIFITFLFLGTPYRRWYSR